MIVSKASLIDKLSTSIEQNSIESFFKDEKVKYSLEVGNAVDSEEGTTLIS